MSTLNTGQAENVSAQDLLDAFNIVRETFQNSMFGGVASDSVFSRAEQRQIASAARVEIVNDGTGGSFTVNVVDGPNGGSSFHVSNSAAGAMLLGLLGVNLCPPDGEPAGEPVDLLQGLPGFSDPSGGFSGINPAIDQFFFNQAGLPPSIPTSIPTVTVFPPVSTGGSINIYNYDFV